MVYALYKKGKNGYLFSVISRVTVFHGGDKGRMIISLVSLALVGVGSNVSWASHPPCDAWVDYMVGTYVSSDDSPKFEGPLFGYRIDVIDLAPPPQALVTDLKKYGLDTLKKYQVYDRSRRKYFEERSHLSIGSGDLGSVDTPQAKTLKKAAYSNSAAAWKAMWAYGSKNNCMNAFLLGLQLKQEVSAFDRNRPLFDKMMAAQRQVSSLQKANHRILSTLDECKAGAPSTIAGNITKQVLEMHEELKKSCPECVEAQQAK